MQVIASGSLPPSSLLHSFVNGKSLAAIAVGIFVCWLGGRGVALLLVGTVLGVALCRGAPVGPLIAAGLVSLLMGWQ